MTILPENQMNNLFENLVTQFVKDNMESIMRDLEGLEVPRNRQSLFQTQL